MVLGATGPLMSETDDWLPETVRQRIAIKDHVYHFAGANTGLVLTADFDRPGIA